MTDQYAVIGNPVAHSKSPQIHAAFAAACGEALEYGAILGTPEAFETQIEALRQQGWRGLNVTLPFKQRALSLATECSSGAALAGAANTLSLSQQGIHADNTDGVGLLRDLQSRLGVAIAGRRVLILGAGGAVRGIVGPLLAASPRLVHLCNRTPARAEAVVDAFRAHDTQGTLVACRPDALLAAAAYDLIVNGTSGSLQGDDIRIPGCVFSAHSVAYDLAYLPDGDTPFLAAARAAGVRAAFDGLGMLVEQAAESFFIWRGIRPATDAVLRDLRAGLRAAR
jgi:shikimate dehydrogenase